MPYAYAPPQPKSGLPPWLVTLGVFAGLLGVGYLFYTLVLNKHGAASASTTQADKAGDAVASKGGRRQRELSKHLEVAGIRIVEENHKPTIRMMLVNHSSAELAQLSGTVTLTAGGQTEFAAMAPYEAKDISAPLKTKLRAYELPDWQFIKGQVSVNAGPE
jgi:hypothetical protein